MSDLVDELRLRHGSSFAVAGVSFPRGIVDLAKLTVPSDACGGFCTSLSANCGFFSALLGLGSLLGRGNQPLSGLLEALRDGVVGRQRVQLALGRADHDARLPHRAAARQRRAHRADRAACPRAPHATSRRSPARSASTIRRSNAARARAARSGRTRATTAWRSARAAKTLRGAGRDLESSASGAAASSSPRRLGQRLGTGEQRAVGGEHGGLLDVGRQRAQVLQGLSGRERVRHARCEDIRRCRCPSRLAGHRRDLPDHLRAAPLTAPGYAGCYAVAIAAAVTAYAPPAMRPAAGSGRRHRTRAPARTRHRAPRRAARGPRARGGSGRRRRRSRRGSCPGARGRSRARPRAWCRRGTGRGGRRSGAGPRGACAARGSRRRRAAPKPSIASRIAAVSSSGSASSTSTREEPATTRRPV